MELFVFRHETWQSLYNNCSNIDITPIPWDQRRHLAECSLLTFLCTIYYLLYIPCVYSFWKNRRDDCGSPNPCYQIMLFISIIDMGALWTISFYISWQFFQGAVYCTHPYANYLLSVMELSLIMIEAVADVVLAFNRCVDILSTYWAAKLFRGKRIWFWLGGCLLYGLVSFTFSNPVVYNGFTLAFTNNPYLGFWDDSEVIFRNAKQLDFNLFTLTFGTPIIYALFIVSLVIKTQKFKHQTERTTITKVQKNAFYQVFTISIFNMIAGTLYYAKEHFPGIISPQFIFLAHFAWVHIHGIPPVIYLLFNKTVRTDVRMLYMKVFKSHRVSHIHGVTILVPNQNYGVPGEPKVYQNAPILGAGKCTALVLPAIDVAPSKKQTKTREIAGDEMPYDLYEGSEPNLCQKKIYTPHFSILNGLKRKTFKTHPKSVLKCLVLESRSSNIGSSNVKSSNVTTRKYTQYME